MQPPGSLRRGAGPPSWRSPSPGLGTRAEVSQLPPRCFGRGRASPGSVPGAGSDVNASPSPFFCAVEKEKTHLEVPLEENINRRVLEEGTVEARTIEDAIAVLRCVAVPCCRSP